MNNCKNCGHPILPAMDGAAFCSGYCRSKWFWEEDGCDGDPVNAENQAENDSDAD